MNKYGNSYLNDSDISGVSGGLSAKKVILGVTAGVAALAAVAYGSKGIYNLKGRGMGAKEAFNPFTKEFYKFGKKIAPPGENPEEGNQK